MVTESPVPIFLLGAVLGGMFILFGCDQVSTPENGIPPSVSGFRVDPDRIAVADLPRDQVADSTATVELSLSVQARDPDGTIDRVVFTVEPSSNPEGAFQGRLEPAEGNEYAWRDSVRLPRIDEVYTIRSYAVDDDSLASNQSVGRLRVAPGD